MKYKYIVFSVLLSGIFLEALIFSLLPASPLTGWALFKSFVIFYIIILGGPVGIVLASGYYTVFDLILMLIMGVLSIASIALNKKRKIVLDISAGLLWCISGCIGLFISLLYVI